MMKGAMVRNPAVATVAVGKAALLCNSALRRILKLSAGKLRKRPAIPASGANSGSPPAVGVPVSIDSMARSSCSASERSGMGALHLSPQVLDGAELKLLHRALAARQFPGNL